MSFSSLSTTNIETQYLRVAPPVTTEQKDLTLVYIGRDYDSTGLDLESAGSGIIADNIAEARTAMLAARQAQQNIDGIIVDIPYNEAELCSLHAFLADNGIKAPLLYNEARLPLAQAKAPLSECIDDVVDLSKAHFDVYSKISFLRKVKENRRQPAPRRPLVLQTLHKQPERWTKRAIDIAVAGLLLLALLPLFLVIALIIKLESKGPVFYNAKRAGRGFKIFAFYKFRTMEVNADKKVEALQHLNQYDSKDSGPKFFKISNDPRITRFGKFLRNTSLDELPQLLNVLKGDMSLVGNRPLPLYEAATLTTNEFVERFMAPAGITGLWQIKKRGKADMSTEERISLDISYARNSNLLYDLWIMANTPGALLQKSSA